MEMSPRLPYKKQYVYWCNCRGNNGFPHYVWVYAIVGSLHHYIMEQIKAMQDADATL